MEMGQTWVMKVRKKSIYWLPVISEERKTLRTIQSFLVTGLLLINVVETQIIGENLVGALEMSGLRELKDHSCITDRGAASDEAKKYFY